MRGRVYLSEEEISIIDDIGVKRDRASIKKDRVCVGYNMSSLEANKLGVAGEYAFCKKYNLYFDPTVRKDVLPAHDCILRDGRKIDVKTKPSDYRTIFVKESDNIYNVDGIIIAVFDREERYVDIIGYISKDDLIKQDKTENSDYGELFYQFNVSRDSLTIIKDKEMAVTLDGFVQGTVWDSESRTFGLRTFGSAEAGAILFSIGVSGQDKDGKKQYASIDGKVNIKDPKEAVRVKSLIENNKLCQFDGFFTPNNYMKDGREIKKVQFLVSDSTTFIEKEVGTNKAVSTPKKEPKQQEMGWDEIPF